MSDSLAQQPPVEGPSAESLAAESAADVAKLSAMSGVDADSSTVDSAVNDSDFTIPTEDEVREALKEVVDPELGVNIVDLGLVYGIFIDEEGGVMLNLTLTTPTCPMTDRLEYEVYYFLQEVAKSVAINWVWLPPWSLDCITEDGREQLRAIGFNL